MDSNTPARRSKRRHTHTASVPAAADGSSGQGAAAMDTIARAIATQQHQKPALVASTSLTHRPSHRHWFAALQSPFCRGRSRTMIQRLRRSFAVPAASPLAITRCCRCCCLATQAARALSAVFAASLKAWLALTTLTATSASCLAQFCVQELLSAGQLDGATQSARKATQLRAHVAADHSEFVRE
jgi:hypothetical protein